MENKRIKIQCSNDTNSNWAVIGKWIEPNDGPEWDIIHSGPLTYEKALEIKINASNDWNKNASEEYKNITHEEVIISYDLLQKMLSYETK